MRLSTPGWCPCCRCSGGCRLLATARYTVSARGRVPASTAGLAPRRTNLWPGGPRRRIARGNWLAGAGAGAAVPARLCGCQPGTGLLPRGTISAVSSPSAKPRRVPRPGWAGQQVTRGTECLAADQRTLGTYWADINHRSLVTISSTICSGPVTLDTVLRVPATSAPATPRLGCWAGHCGRGLTGFLLGPD